MSFISTNQSSGLYSHEYLSLQLAIQNQREEVYQHFVKDASPLRPHHLSRISILYVMNIKALNPIYNSLILDQHGTVYLTRESTTVIANDYLQKFGFRYQCWLSYLQERTHQKRTCYPFVYFNHVYLSIPVKNDHHYRDWLNIRTCCQFEMGCKKRHLTNPTLLKSNDQLVFTFHLDNWNQQETRFIISHQVTSIYQQIHYAYYLTRDWYNYLEFQLLQSQIPFQIDRLPLYINPVYAFESPNPAKHFHLLPEDLKNFMNYQAVMTYLTRPNDPLSQHLSPLLRPKHLDQDSIREPLAYYRANYQI